MYMSEKMDDKDVTLEDIWWMLLMKGKITITQFINEEITVVNIKKYWDEENI